MTVSYLLRNWVSQIKHVGRMRHRLVIEAVQSVPDEAGGWQVAYKTLGAVWAAIRPVGVDTSHAPRQSGETITHELTLRYRADMQVGMRLRQGEACYVIRLLVDPDHRKNWLLCLCSQERS